MPRAGNSNSDNIVAQGNLKPSNSNQYNSNFNLGTILIDRVNMAKKSKISQYVPLTEILYQNTCIWFFDLMPAV